MANNVPDHRKRNTFTSYVAPHECLGPAVTMGDTSSLQADNDWCLSSDARNVWHLAKPRLLPSEQIVASAPAYLYPAISNIDSISNLNSPVAVFGLLTVTNFKLSFVPLQQHHHNQVEAGNANGIGKDVVSDNKLSQEHLILQKNDVTLNNIDYVVQVGETGRAVSALPGQANRRRKRLDAQQKLMSGRIAALHIICKNFRLLKFAFQYTSKSGRDWGKLIASALARFAFTSRHDLSFAYTYNEPYFPIIGKTGTSMYSSKNDWARELIRCSANNWQVISTESIIPWQPENQTSSSTNNAMNNLKMQQQLPPHFVIPKGCSVERFLEYSKAFCDSRAPFWVYGYGTAALVRLAELKSSVQQDTTVENVLLELVRACNERKMLHLLQLTDRLPNIQDVQRAYLKLRRLCTPDSPQQFLVEDTKFLTLFEKSNWLFYVSLCLRYACEAAGMLRKGTTCVLQDTNGRDLCCVVSSLTQIILDPWYRTIDGFQSLIQKDWVALEHPFQRRLGQVRLVIDDNSPDEESPVFLLFLDCVWQMLQQYPEEFEFCQTYLTTLWDSCFLPLFDTFQFDCNADRQRAEKENGLILRPVWDWSEQFADKDKMFFNNPFYQRQRLDNVPCRRSVAIPAGAIMLPGLAKPHRVTMQAQNANQSLIAKDRYLEPNCSTAVLAIWEQCYFRWMPMLEIKCGGQVQVELYHRYLLNNISRLQRAIELQDYDDLPDIYYEKTKEPRPNLATVDGNKAGNSSPEMIDGVERRRHPVEAKKLSSVEKSSGTILPEISSYFPFGGNSTGSQQLYENLSSSQEYLLEGSVIDRLSLA